MRETRTPMRRCIGCMQSHPQKDLTRLTLVGDKIAVDRKRNAEGRGVYLCKNKECISKARKTRAFNRSFRRQLDQISTEAVLDELLEEL